MALDKPVVVVTQDLSTVPFDVKDMQALGYDRTQMNATLGSPLRTIVQDTLPHMRSPTATREEGHEDQLRLVTSLGVQLAELKDMVGQMVREWHPSHAVPPPAGERAPDLTLLEGAFGTDVDTHIYVRIVNGVLVAPYCYSGNDHLTAYYYDWQLMGSYYFARFKWIEGAITGFTFLRQLGTDRLDGSWWHSDLEVSPPSRPIEGSGNPIIWRRRLAYETPRWAEDFFERIRSGKEPGVA